MLMFVCVQGVVSVGVWMVALVCGSKEGRWCVDGEKVKEPNIGPTLYICFAPYVKGLSWHTQISVLHHT
jgi:hypothetical protein